MVKALSCPFRANCLILSRDVCPGRCPGLICGKPLRSKKKNSATSKLTLRVSVRLNRFQVTRFVPVASEREGTGGDRFGDLLLNDRPDSVGCQLAHAVHPIAGFFQAALAPDAGLDGRRPRAERAGQSAGRCTCRCR